MESSEVLVNPNRQDILVTRVQQMDLKNGDFVVFECGQSISQDQCAALVNMVTQIGAKRGIHLAAIVLRGDMKLGSVLRLNGICAFCLKPLVRGWRAAVRRLFGLESVKDGGALAHPECVKAKV